MNISFTQKAQNALSLALYYAGDLGHTYVGTEHLLLGLLAERDGIASKVLRDRGVTDEGVRAGIVKAVGIGERSGVSARDYTPRTKRVIETSAALAAQNGHGYIGTEHLLLAITDEPDSYAVQLIAAEGASVSEIRDDIIAYFGSSERESGERRPGAGRAGRPGDGSTPTLSSYGRDLCKMAKEGKIDPIIGRDEETERVIQILSRRTKNNPCLIGEPGVGKTAVVEGLAQRIVDGSVPDTLRGKTIFTLDLSGMIAGAKYRGEFEERMKSVMEEVSKNKNVILFIDEIHTIIGAGSAEGAVDAANIIKPALARGEMQLIGATTIDEYRKHIEKDAALERRFQSVMVGEPSPEDAVLVLRGLRDKYEAHHKVKITDEAIEAAVKLSVRYIGDRYLPDKAIDLIDEACSKKRISGAAKSPAVRDLEAKLKAATAEKEEAILGEDYEGAAALRDKEKKLREALDAELGKPTDGTSPLVVTVDDIADVVTAWTHIPVKKLADEEGERLLHLDELLRERIIGQDEAVSADEAGDRLLNLDELLRERIIGHDEAVSSVARAIRRGRVGLKDPRRPIGSFIFLGPTGVGKTELCKALADVMFGDENAMIRVDMSEYMEKHSVSKMIGSPPGYVGYDEGGQLTEKVRRRPYSVVLFDEIEKAHPDVFNMLLQILEDGILTDAQGRRVDFKNTVIIMTSNCGAGAITEPKHLGFTAESGSDDKMRENVMDALKGTFRPEFLNRIDEIVVFNKLSDEDIRKIASLMLTELAGRIVQSGVSVTFDGELVAHLAKVGFDPVYGARPLRRAIVRSVEDSLSEAMLAGEVKPGDTVTAKLSDGKVVYEKA
ncbi:MAG: ATP-dependent Clp protease ATP-binding subunit [Clostridia bacterium]|nr:ATP-dependent Clp protease ATP-binding subunit [Clostridia bacterium]